MQKSEIISIRVSHRPRPAIAEWKDVNYNYKFTLRDTEAAKIFITALLSHYVNMSLATGVSPTSNVNDHTFLIDGHRRVEKLTTDLSGH